jgi:hypothetical protein
VEGTLTYLTNKWAHIQYVNKVDGQIFSYHSKLKQFRYHYNGENLVTLHRKNIISTTFKDDDVGTRWNILNHWEKKWKLQVQKRIHKLKATQKYFLSVQWSMDKEYISELLMMAL